MTVDVRTRTDDDIRDIDPRNFFSRQLPALLAKNGPTAARAAAVLDLGPLVLRIDNITYTLAPAAETIEIATAEPAERSVTVEFAADAFSDWVQEVRSMLALLVSKQARVTGGDSNAALAWDVVLRAMVDGRPMYEPGSVTLTDLDGAPLDVNRSFTLDADDAELKHFLEQTGFLVLRQWVPADVVAAISADIDRGIQDARRDDPRRWWAKLENGTDTCVRLKRFDQVSEAGKRAGESAVMQRLARLTGDPFAFPPSWIESLIKPTGIISGPSEIRWHKDCWQGKHAFFCSGMTVGILLKSSNERTGGIRVMAGSHRTNFPAADRQINEVDLPLRTLYGEPGDLTVHLSCAMHETIAPSEGERRVMYAGFSLVDPSSGSGVDQKYPIKHADWSKAVSSAWNVYA